MVATPGMDPLMRYSNHSSPGSEPRSNSVPPASWALRIARGALEGSGRAGCVPDTQIMGETPTHDKMHTRIIQTSFRSPVDESISTECGDSDILPQDSAPLPYPIPTESRQSARKIQLPCIIDQIRPVYINSCPMDKSEILSATDMVRSKEINDKLAGSWETQQTIITDTQIQPPSDTLTSFAGYPTAGNKDCNVVPSIEQLYVSTLNIQHIWRRLRKY